MLDGSMVLPVILNILAVSIPESTFLLLFTLIVIKRFDLLDLEKTKLLKMAIIVVVAAVSSTVLRVSLILDAVTAPFYGLFLYLVLILFLFGIKTPKGVLKTFLSVCAAFLTVFAMEIMVYPILSSTPGFSADMVNKPGLATMVFSIPERVMQIILIVILLLKRKSFMKLGYFKVISRSRPFAYVIGGLVIFNLLFIYIMFKLIFFDNILEEIEAVMQIFAVALIIVFPLLNMSVLITSINYLVNRHTSTKVHIRDEARVLRILVHTLLRQQRYNEVDTQMESFAEGIEKVK